MTLPKVRVRPFSQYRSSLPNQPALQQRRHADLGRALVHVAALATVLLTASSALAQPEPLSSAPEELFRAANEQFHDALQADDAIPGSGQAAFLAAAALYQSLITEHHLENHALHTNRAAALLLAGDTGRAIAAFRRAERLEPSDPAVRQGLASARARVATAIAPAPESRLRQILLAWRGQIPRATLLTAAVAAHAVAWLAAAARVFGVRRATAPAFAAAAVAVLAAAPLAIEEVLEAGPDHAVVIAREVVALNGPSPGAYAPTFAAPLTAGVECVILESRDGWLRIRLPDARETWLPADAVERL